MAIIFYWYLVRYLIWTSNHKNLAIADLNRIVSNVRLNHYDEKKQSYDFNLEWLTIKSES
jgi:hypothetical protein